MHVVIHLSDAKPRGYGVSIEGVFHIEEEFSARLEGWKVFVGFVLVVPDDEYGLPHSQADITLPPVLS